MVLWSRNSNDSKTFQGIRDVLADGVVGPVVVLVPLEEVTVAGDALVEDASALLGRGELSSAAVPAVAQRVALVAGVDAPVVDEADELVARDALVIGPPRVAVAVA